MSNKVEYNKVSSKDEAYEAVKKAVTPEMLAKFQVSAELDYKSDLITAKGKGFKLDMKFDDQSCWFELELSFLLKPLRSKIESSIEKQLIRIV